MTEASPTGIASARIERGRSAPAADATARASASRPIEARLRGEGGLSQEEAARLALQLAGAIKGPLFYPRLMGAAPTGEPGRVIAVAVATTCARLAARG